MGLLIHNNGLIGRRNGTLYVLPALSVDLLGTSRAMLARGPVAQRQRRICPCRPEGGFCLLSSIRSRWGAYGPTLTCSANNMTDRPSVCILSLALKKPQYRRFGGLGCGCGAFLLSSSGCINKDEPLAMFQRNQSVRRTCNSLFNHISRIFHTGPYLCLVNKENDRDITFRPGY